MNPKQFYDGLGLEDRERVRLTVEELKVRGFEVYVAGSSLERANYNDIDLVAKPQEGMAEGDARAGLDAVVTSLKVRGATEAVDYTRIIAKRIITELVPDSHRYVQSDVSFRHGLSFGNDLGTLLDEGPRYVQSRITGRRELSFRGDLELPKDTLTYMMSTVAGRKSLSWGETKIDISVSYQPFGLNPNTKHVQL